MGNKNNAIHCKKYHSSTIMTVVSNAVGEEVGYIVDMAGEGVGREICLGPKANSRRTLVYADTFHFVL